MEIKTSRFGCVEVETPDAIQFPQGLVGLEDCQQWVLLGDGHNDLLAWMQSTSRPEIALPVVSPRRFVPDYRVHVRRSDLAPLGLENIRDAHVLVVVGQNERSITLNLKAPIIINLARLEGRQVINLADKPLQFELEIERGVLRKTA